MTGAADEVRAGRNVRVEEPVSALLSRKATRPPSSPSLAQLYDRLVQAASLRRWIDAQPAESWRLVELRRAYPGNDEVRLHMVTTGYERAALATARPDGTGVSVDLPTAADRARVFPRRPATLPAGIRVIPEEVGYEATDDILPGSLELPRGASSSPSTSTRSLSMSRSSRAGIPPTRRWRRTRTSSRASRSPRSCCRRRRPCAGSASARSPP